MSPVPPPPTGGRSVAHESARSITLESNLYRRIHKVAGRENGRAIRARTTRCRPRKMSRPVRGPRNLALFLSRRNLIGSARAPADHDRLSVPLPSSSTLRVSLADSSSLANHRRRCSFGRTAAGFRKNASQIAARNCERLAKLACPESFTLELQLILPPLDRLETKREGVY